MKYDIIKFRQRNKNNGQWHYWGCIRDGEFTGPMTSDNYVKPEKSNEFTGLSDKNGEEVYENDIVTFSTHKGFNKVCPVGCVVWSKSRVSFMFKPPGKTKQLTLEKKNLHVIGNIYSTPGLLK